MIIDKNYYQIVFRLLNLKKKKNMKNVENYNRP